MGFWELALVAIGLSMDALAVSVCKGLASGSFRVKNALLAGLYFGAFQAVMPLAGYLLGTGFARFIAEVDHWVALVMLAGIGANMIRESRGNAEKLNASFGPRAMLPLAVATSIDALAIGVTFAFLQVEIPLAAGLIGGITFLISGAGVAIGCAFGAKCKGKAELIGGIVLICMGLKIFLEHMGVFG